MKQQVHVIDLRDSLQDTEPKQKQVPQKQVQKKLQQKAGDTAELNETNLISIPHHLRGAKERKGRKGSTCPYLLIIYYSH